MLEKANATPFLYKFFAVSKNSTIFANKYMILQGEIYEIPYWNTDI